MNYKRLPILLFLVLFFSVFVSCTTPAANTNDAPANGVKVADTPTNSTDPATSLNTKTSETENTPSAPSSAVSTPLTSTPSASTPPDPQKNITVALTFDDGPHASYTPRLLDALKERDVKATFFMIGLMAEKNPSIVKRISDEGHSLGNHSYSHKSFSKMTKQQILDEISKTDNIIMDACGKKASFLRTPYGDVTPTIKECAGKPIVLWNVDPEDWKYKDVETIKNNVISTIKDNCIVLMHDIYSTSVDAAIAIIDELKAQGVRFVTVEELLNSCYDNVKDGGVYFSG